MTSIITYVTLPQKCAERRGLEPHRFRGAPAFETGCNTCMRDSPYVPRAFRRDRTADLSLFRGALYRLSYKGISNAVPAVGVEPTCPCGHRGLSSARMPFRQTGKLGGAKWCTKPPTHGFHPAALSALGDLAMSPSRCTALGFHCVPR